MLPNSALLNICHFFSKRAAVYISCLCFFSSAYAEEATISITSEYDDIKEEYYTKHNDGKPWLEEAEFLAAKTRRINLYYLATKNANEGGVIQWNAPDGRTYFLNPKTAPIGTWSYTYDQAGNKVMAYLHKNGQDSILQLSLGGANSRSSTLLHHEDDFAYEPIYIAVDLGNESSNQLRPSPAIIIRARNRVLAPPLRAGGAWHVMTVCPNPKCK